MQSRLQSKSRDVFPFDKPVFLVVLVQVKGQLHSNLTFHKCDVQQKQMQNADMGKIHSRSCTCSLTLQEGSGDNLLKNSCQAITINNENYFSHQLRELFNSHQLQESLFSATFLHVVLAYPDFILPCWIFFKANFR